MQLVADLHLHSKYSRATSKELDLFGLYRWCLKKGISLIGTADFTHPRWFSELKQHLEPAGEGIFRLKSTSLQDYKTTVGGTLVDRSLVDPYYVLTSEISCIYTQAGKMRRIHVVLLASSLETVEKVNKALAKRGNLFSDGRPIFGMSAYELTKTVWDVDENVIVIPAHIWTPWFSLFGSMSGFDSIEECFNEFSDQIYAIETGLSSDPPMNWRLSQLDKVAIVSFGDGHSGGNLMREATVFGLGDEPSFSGIVEALKNSSAVALESRIRNHESWDSKPRIVKTIEFYPEEGKYHFDGHRLCGIRFSPQESKTHGNLCPKCHRPLTIGVMNRVEQLADRPEDYIASSRPPYQSLVQLSQIIAEAFGKGEATQAVKQEYDRLVERFGDEYTMCVDTELQKLEHDGVHPLIVDGLRRARAGSIHIEPGYDGVFGRVRVLEDSEGARKLLSSQRISDRQQTLF